MDSPHSVEVDPDGDPLLDLALIALDHAIDSVEASGGPLIPFVLSRVGGEMGLQRLVFARAIDPTGAEVVLAQRYEVRGLLRKTATRVGNPALVEDSRRGN